MELQDYLKLIFRWSWLLILGAIVAATVSYAVLRDFTPWPPYEATATLMIGDDHLATSLGVDSLHAIRDTYAELARRPPITHNVIEGLGLSMSAKDLAERINIVYVGGTRLLELSIVDSDPHQAAAIVNELAHQLDQHPPVNIIAHAEVPTRPKLDPFLLIIVAAALGVTVTTGVILLIEYFNNTIRNTQDIDRRLGLPVLGSVKVDRGKSWPGFNKLRQKSNSRQQEVLDEQYRWLQVYLHQQDGKPLDRLLVTSPHGLPTQAIFTEKLAAAWLAAGQPVKAIDAQDGSLPDAASYQVYENGNTPVLLKEAKPQVTHQEVLSPVPAVDISPRLVEQPPLLDTSDNYVSTEAWEPLNGSGYPNDLLIINGPPVLPTADAAIMTADIHNVLLVFEAQKTQISAAQESIQILDRAGGKIIGAVLVE